jgi:hypothetical protein
LNYGDCIPAVHYRDTCSFQFAKQSGQLDWFGQALLRQSQDQTLTPYPFHMLLNSLLDGRESTMYNASDLPDGSVLVEQAQHRPSFLI